MGRGSGDAGDGRGDEEVTHQVVTADLHDLLLSMSERLDALGQLDAAGTRLRACCGAVALR